MEWRREILRETEMEGGDRYGAEETKIEKWPRRRKKTEMEGRDKYRGRSQI
jgi:hypothetical protein